MRKKGIEPMHGDHVNVTPLIDVVMCLIIFFMICGKLVKDDLEGKVEVPEARLGQEISEQRGRVIINLVPDESIIESLVQGGIRTPEEQRQAMGRVPPVMKVHGRIVAPADLTELLKNEVKANKDTKIMVRADQVQEYKYISPILVSCAQADIRSVNFTTRKLAE